MTCPAGSACFVIVHVATPIDTSLARNAARPPSLAVPSEVVLRMAQAMDVPGPGGPPFESNLLKLPADGDALSAQLLLSPAAPWSVTTRLT